MFLVRPNDAIKKKGGEAEKGVIMYNNISLILFYMMYRKMVAVLPTRKQKRVRGDNNEAHKSVWHC
jgi:hypothetical protein